MRKFLPLFLFLIGLFAFIGVYFFVIKGKKESTETPTGEESALIEIPLSERPVVSLTPTADGHYLNLKIEKILGSAASLDYELLYSVPGGGDQGVPGTVSLTGENQVERKLLLGSESSGKFRYDEGVENGSITLRFRNSAGKLMAKFSTDFHLQSGTDVLTSKDGSFSVMLAKKPKAFFVVMETFGLPDSPPVNVAAGPYGLFSSSASELEGTAKIGTYRVYRHIAGPRWSDENEDVILDSETGIFIGTSE